MSWVTFFCTYIHNKHLPAALFSFILGFPVVPLNFPHSSHWNPVPWNCKTLLTLSQSHTYASFLHGIKGSSHFCTTTSQSASTLPNKKLLTITSFFNKPLSIIRLPSEGLTLYWHCFLTNTEQSACWNSSCCLPHFHSLGSGRDFKFSIPPLRLFLFLVPCGAL